jgi:hypothetical protein
MPCAGSDGGYGSAVFNDLSGANPTYGNLAPAVFSFKTNCPPRLRRWRCCAVSMTTSARPVYNRLFWNFTGEEAAYANNYNVTDVNGTASSMRRTMISSTDTEILAIT